MKKCRKNDVPFPAGGKYAAALLLVIGFVSLIRCTGDRAPGDAETYASLDPDVGYVGMQTCRSCHADIYDSFSHTGMGLSFDRSSLSKSAAGPGPHAPVYDAALDFYYQATWSGDSLYVLEFRLDGNDTVHRRLQFVHYIVGSGQHTNSHIYNLNGYLHQVPLTYYTQDGKWDLPPGFENGGNSRFSRQIGLECMSCHNAYPEMVPGSENKYSMVGNGIDCERCHGPGERHVAEKRGGKLVDISSAVDYSIVNPAKLPVSLQFDVCQRCHIQGNAVLKEGKSFFDFRPGMPLSDVMHVFMPVWEGREDEHIMASHAERLKMSACYTGTSAGDEDALYPGKRSLTCITCHDPHVSVRETASRQFNTACTGCHTGGKDDCKASKADLEKAEFNCVQCHMAGSGAIDIPHVKVTDHLIRVPVPDSVVDRIRVFAGIDCINDADPPPAARGQAFIQYFEKFGFDRFVLDSARKYFPSRNRAEIQDHFAELVHMAFLERDYEKLTGLVDQAGIPPDSFGQASWSNKDAWTCYRIGEALRDRGRDGESLGFLRRAVQLAPYNLEFRNVYGSGLMGAGRTAEAIETFEFVISEFPDNTTALSNLGYVLLSARGDTARARALYMRALVLDPDYLAAWYNLAGLYIYQERFGDAGRVLEEILEKHPGEVRARRIRQSLRISLP